MTGDPMKTIRKAAGHGQCTGSQPIPFTGLGFDLRSLLGDRTRQAAATPQRPDAKGEHRQGAPVRQAG